MRSAWSSARRAPKGDPPNPSNSTPPSRRYNGAHRLRLRSSLDQDLGAGSARSRLWQGGGAPSCAPLWAALAARPKGILRTPATPCLGAGDTTAHSTCPQGRELGAGPTAPCSGKGAGRHLALRPGQRSPRAPPKKKGILRTPATPCLRAGGATAHSAFDLGRPWIRVLEQDQPAPRSGEGAGYHPVLRLGQRSPRAQKGDPSDPGNSIPQSRRYNGAQRLLSGPRAWRGLASSLLWPGGGAPSCAPPWAALAARPQRGSFEPRQLRASEQEIQRHTAPSTSVVPGPRGPSQAWASRSLSSKGG